MPSKKSKETRSTVFIGILILVAVGLIMSFYQQNEHKACTMEAKICPDGSAVGRNSTLNCEFDPCPALQYCDSNRRCPDEKMCYKFEDNEKPYCYEGEPCIKCASGKCSILKSNPPQIACE
jgi:hypothetical protein